MRSGAKVLLTAMSVISPGFRPARCAAAAIRSRISATFSAMDIEISKPRSTLRITKENEDRLEFAFRSEAPRKSRARAPAPHHLFSHHGGWGRRFVWIARA